MVKRGIAPKTIAAFKDRVREITCRAGGQGMTEVVEELKHYLPGWKAYFRLVETPTILKDLDKWIRHRLRAIQLKQWQRGPVVYRNLRKLGASEKMAAVVAADGCGRWWHRSQHEYLNLVLTVSYFDRLGVPRLS